MSGEGAASANEARFHAHFERVLGEQLAAANADRVRTLRAILKWWLTLVPALIGIAVGVRFLPNAGQVADPVLGVCLFGLLFALVWPHNKYYNPYQKAFKHKLVAPLVAAYRPGMSYAPEAGIERHELDSSGLFRNPTITDVRGEDRVDGLVGDVAFKFSEVFAEHVKRWTGPDNSQKSKTHHVFNGLFYVADFNKHFSGRTYVLPDRAQRLLGGVGHLLQGSDDKYGELVKLEDPEFERKFVVYSSSQVEARYILSSALMQRILALQLRTNKPLRIAFASSRLYVAIATNTNHFEPRLFTPIDRELFQEYWDVLDLLGGIVEALNLETRIWTKA